MGQNANAQSELSFNSGNAMKVVDTNETYEKENYQNFSSDFKIMDDTKKWKRISGIWNYSTDGYQGSIKESVDTPINVIMSPVNSNDSIKLATSFAINEITNQNYSYVSIVYGLQDSFNYRQAGIYVENGNLSVFANTIDDNVTKDTFVSPIQNSNQLVTSNKPFKMSLVLENNNKTLFVNDLKFPLSVINNNTDGKVGLGYGGMQSIAFFDFKAQSILNLPANENKNNTNITKATDTLTIMLNDRSIPENSYIPIYDSMPYRIIDGHVSAKLPCNEDLTSNIQISAGNSSMLNPIKLQALPELSISGEICAYVGDILSGQDTTNSYIILQNNSTDDIDFPGTSSITISIAKLEGLTTN